MQQQDNSIKLDPKLTAVLFLDFTDTITSLHKSSQEAISQAKKLLNVSRKANATIIFSTTLAQNTQIIPELSPESNELIISAKADKFYKTNLEDYLGSKNIKYLVLVGGSYNGAILYTTFSACLRDFTVIILEDCVFTDDDYALQYSKYQILNQPGFVNRVTIAQLSNFSF